jgi:hypothetical protein
MPLALRSWTRGSFPDEIFLEPEVEIGTEFI